MNTKVIAEAYTITSTLGAQFEFDGVPSFVTKAIPLGGTEEETFVLPYARCWNELAYLSNNHLIWRIRTDLAQLFSWGALDLPVPKGSFFDVPEGWAIRLDELAYYKQPQNAFEMKYHAMEIDFGARGNFVPFKEETWTIGDKSIETPHGLLQIEKAIFVEQGSLVGIQFTVEGTLELGDFSCSNGDEGGVQIKTFAVVRQPHNVWLWCYAFDKNNMPCVNFCGHDDLDGLLHFYTELKSK